MTKRVMITVGGTGGHIYPALALAQQLQKNPGMRVLFVGGSLAANRYFDREAFDYRTVACGSFVKKNPIKWILSLSSILTGVWQSRSIIRNYSPDVVVGFGSFYTLPTLLAAKSLSIPIILHEANSIPGRVNRLLSKYAVVTGVHFPETKAHLKGKTQVVGMPLREGFTAGSVSKCDACNYFNLDDKTTLLIFGGSQGARSLNILCADALASHLPAEYRNLQVIHFTGDSRLSFEIEQCYKKCNIKACVKDFELRMDLAWQAADLMISRAGAGSIAEAIEFEVPGILIPYPHAADNHQDKNAEFMVERVRGAIKIVEKQLNARVLSEAIQDLLQKDRQKSMKKAISEYKQCSQTEGLCSLVLSQRKKDRI